MQQAQFSLNDPKDHSIREWLQCSDINVRPQVEQCNTSSLHLLFLRDYML